MTTTIAVLLLACIVVVFMMIKRLMKNNIVELSEDSERKNDNAKPYRPPTVEFKINHHENVLYSARSSKSN